MKPPNAPFVVPPWTGAVWDVGTPPVLQRPFTVHENDHRRGDASEVQGAAGHFGNEAAIEGKERRIAPAILNAWVSPRSEEEVAGKRAETCSLRAAGFRQ
jgi:hypothetical protein